VPVPEGRPRVLCVDDEPLVLEAMQDNLRRTFDLTTAAGGAEGLAKIQDGPPFAVVVSDMRMPGMDGATFLSFVRQVSPDTVRMLLTGQSDMDTAVLAVNEGQIFRFLTKPCARADLLQAVRAAVEQHELITAERVLLEETLHGSMRALTEILSLANPTAFGRATRLKGHMSTLAARQGVEPRWAFEVAAMLSQIGCVTLPEETAEKLYWGRPLTDEELALVDRVPQTAEKLLRKIPRIEPVREILASQNRRFDSGGDLPVGARMLKIVLDYDLLETQGLDTQLALDTMRGRAGWYDPDLLDAFGELRGSFAQGTVVKELRLRQLEPGQTFADDVRSRAGALLVPRGYEVTPELLERLSYLKDGYAQEPVRVVVAVPGDD